MPNQTVSNCDRMQLSKLDCLDQKEFTDLIRHDPNYKKVLTLFNVLIIITALSLCLLIISTVSSHIRSNPDLQALQSAAKDYAITQSWTVISVTTGFDNPTSDGSYPVYVYTKGGLRKRLTCDFERQGLHRVWSCKGSIKGSL